MSFTSYAQNFEDVMLWRALKHIKNGFYIDIGGWSPDVDSVTLAFYENNWSGINIEPNPIFYKEFNEKRTRDINLQVAVAEKAGKLVMNFLDNPGLSTLDDNIAEKHIRDGLKANREEVKVETLDSIWQQYIKPTQDVHFLKIDVEGFEFSVIKSNNWKQNRPWILVIEATLPMSQEENYSDWEPVLLKNEYLFAYADGLNRFYVAKEHSELLNAFQYPPNVFDKFVRIRNIGDLVRFLPRLPRLITTYLLRYLIAFLQKSVSMLMRWVIRKPKLKAIAMSVLQRLPSLRHQLKAIEQRYRLTHQPMVSQSSLITDRHSLSPRAQKIYLDLKQAIEQHKKEGE